MFNNTTNIFIDTLASLQKIDDLERLINPNSAFLQSYRDSFNEINLNFANQASMPELAKFDVVPCAPITIGGEHRFDARNIPSLDCLPQAIGNSRAVHSVHDKENGTIIKRTDCSVEAKIEKVNNVNRVGFTRIETSVDKMPELNTHFSFQKVETTKPKEKKVVSNVVSLSKCTCANSRCLKLYCACFSNGEGCGPQCQCKGCFNNDANVDIRLKMIEETLQKNPNAFKSKYKKHTQKDAVVHVRGCNCTKTGCIKEYCECFKIGTGCSRLCRCVNCLNKKIELKNEEIKEYYVKAIRKRRKTKFYEESFGGIKKKSTEDSKAEL